MKFLIRRASNWLDYKGEDIDKKFNPRFEVYDRYDIRTLATPEAYNEKFADNWFDKGIDHTIIKIDGKDHIQRKFKNDMTGLFIDICSLDDLIEFQNVYGQIIIRESSGNNYIKEILIYDDYIE